MRLTRRIARRCLQPFNWRGRSVQSEVRDHRPFYCFYHFLDFVWTFNTIYLCLKP